MGKRIEPLLYRLHFYQEGKRITLHAKHIIINEAMPGFVGVEELVFDDSAAGIINSTDEKLKAEFRDVKSFYIACHDMIRIDEVNAKGESKITETPKEQGSNIIKPPAFGRILTPHFPGQD